MSITLNIEIARLKRIIICNNFMFKINKALLIITMISFNNYLVYIYFKYIFDSN